MLPDMKAWPEEHARVQIRNQWVLLTIFSQLVHKQLSGIYHVVHLWRDLTTERTCHRESKEARFHFRHGRGRPTGLLKGHPAKLLQGSTVKPTGAAFDRHKLVEVYDPVLPCKELVAHCHFGPTPQSPLI